MTWFFWRTLQKCTNFRILRCNTQRLNESHRLVITDLVQEILDIDQFIWCLFLVFIIDQNKRYQIKCFIKTLLIRKIWKLKYKLQCHCWKVFFQDLVQGRKKSNYLQVTLVRGLAQLFLVEILSLNYQQTIYPYNFKQPDYHWFIFYKNWKKNFF